MSNLAQFNTALWGGGADAPPGTTYSARTLGYSVLRLLGVLRAGMGPSDDWLADCLFHLNMMLDGFNADRLKIHAVARTTHTLTADVQEYTLGLGGSIDRVRPPKVEAMALLDASGNECRLHPLSIELKMIEAHGYYLDGSYPLQNLWISDVPSSGDQLAIYGWEHLQAFADLETLYSFPEGYGLMILYSLAEQIAPTALISQKIPEVLHSEVIRQARMYRQRVAAINPPTLTTRCENALLGIGDGWGHYRRLW